VPIKNVALFIDAMAVVHREPNGESTVVARLGPGEVVGEVALVLRRPANASVIAQHPTVTLMLPREREPPRIHLRPEPAPPEPGQHARDDVAQCRLQSVRTAEHEQRDSNAEDAERRHPYRQMSGRIPPQRSVGLAPRRQRR
jgi:hypothetical protein